MSPRIILKTSGTEPPDPLAVKLVEFLNLEAEGKVEYPKPSSDYSGDDPMEWWVFINLHNHHQEKCSVDLFGSVCEEEATGWFRGKWIKEVYLYLEGLTDVEKAALEEVVALHNGCWPHWVEFEGMMGRCDSHGYVDS